MRREIPILIAIVVGFVYVIQFFVPHPPFDKFQSWGNDWIQIIAGFAIVLGVLNLLKTSLEKIYKKSKDCGYAVIIIMGFLIMTAAGLFFSGGKNYQNPGTPFYYIFFNIYFPLNATMFAILAFFVASASYRAFRARNKEATLLLLAAIFLMLGRTPLGDYMSGWLPTGWQLKNVSDWIMDFPQTAGQRAIMIGIALGIISTSLRVITGLERTFVGGE